MAQLGLTIKVGLDKKSLKQATSKMGNFLKGGLKAGATGAAGALGAIGVAAGVAAAATLDFAEDANAAMEQFRRETGKSAEEVEEFGKSAKNLFAAGLGDDISDVTDAMSEISNVMQTGAKETEDLTKKALVMRDVYDKDIGESIDAAKVLMDEFGLTSDEAFDFMATGIQKGLDRSGDFIDSIGEYSNQFSNAGFEADDFFAIMEQGVQGGVLGTDKVNDAMKELGIRLNEGGKDTRKAFENMGLDFDGISKFIRSGDENWSDYFTTILEGVNEIEDPMERAQTQAMLFGTMAEDLGSSFTEDLANAFKEGSNSSVVSIEEMTGAIDEAEKQNRTMSESVAILGRQLVTSLEPAAQELLPFLAEGVEVVSDFLRQAQPIFVGFPQQLSQKLGPALAIIGDSLRRVGQVFGVAGEGASGMETALAFLEKTLNFVVTAIEGVAVASTMMAEAFETAKGLGQQVGQIAGAIFGTDEDTADIPSMQGGGVVPGAPSQAVPIMAHGGEEIANPNAGQAVVIGGETFAVREAQRLADAVNKQRRKDMQMLVDVVAGAMT
jgi:phage-related minor tail protein